MRLDSLIERRFHEWMPWVTIDIRCHSFKPPSLNFDDVHDVYRQIHRDAFLLARAAGLSMPVIRRQNIDSPLIDEFERRRRIALAVRAKSVADLRWSASARMV